MNRPAPRKSNLAGTTAFTTPTPAVAVVAEPVTDVSRVRATPQSSGADESAAPVRTADKYPRLNYYVDSTHTAGRIRAAFIAGRSRYGWRTFSDMQAAGVLALVEQLEQEINNGEQFVPAPAGAVPTGRSVE